MTVLVSLAAQADFSYLTSEPVAFVEAWGETPVWEARLLRSGGARGLGLESATMHNVLSGSSDAFAAALGARRRGRPFVEMVVGAPKSISLLAGLGSAEERAKVVEAHRAAVAAVHARIESELLWTRVGTPDGRLYRKAPRLEAAEFVHFLSRRLDPHLHSHVVIPNVAFCNDGKSRAIDAETLKFAGSHLDLLYLTALEESLANRGLGGKTVQGPIEMASQYLAESGVFCRRREDVAKEMNESGAPSRIARLRSRPLKPAVIDVAGLVRDWSLRATSLPLGHPDTARATLLETEIASLRVRLAAAARTRGEGILDAELRHTGSPALSKQRMLDYGSVILDDELRGRAGGAGFGSPPPRQRAYDRADVARLSSLLGEVRAATYGAPGGVFLLAKGAGELFSLEAAARGAALGGSVLVGSAIDEALEWRKVGKPLAASITRLPPGETAPRGAALIVSHLEDPAAIASMIEAGAGAGGVLVVDSARLDPATGQPAGRGAGWRSWLAQQVEEEPPERRAYAVHAEAVPPLALGRGLVLYQSSEALRSGIAARAAAGEDLLVADERLATGDIQVVVARGSGHTRGVPETFAPGSPEAELCSDSSLAQGVSLQSAGPVYLMAPPVAPVAAQVDVRLADRVMELVGLRLPAFGAGRWAVDRDGAPPGKEEVTCDQLCDENLAILARLGQGDEVANGRADTSRTDRQGEALNRLLLSTLSVPVLDPPGGQREALTDRLLSLLDLMEVSRAGPAVGVAGRDPRTWLVERARTLITGERERRMEAEVSLEIEPRRTGRLREAEPPQRILELERDACLGGL